MSCNSVVVLAIACLYLVTAVCACVRACRVLPWVQYTSGGILDFVQIRKEVSFCANFNLNDCNTALAPKPRGPLQEGSDIAFTGGAHKPGSGSASEQNLNTAM
jgi:hypothetical protein